MRERERMSTRICVNINLMLSVRSVVISVYFLCSKYRFIAVWLDSLVLLTETVLLVVIFVRDT